MLIDISHREDNTILFVTHDVAEAVYLADTVYVLESATGADPASDRCTDVRGSDAGKGEGEPGVSSV